MVRGKDVVFSLLVVGTAAAAGYALQGWQRAAAARSTAEVGARLVDRASVPTDATVVDVSSRRLREIPGVRRAIDRAVSNDAHERWEHVTLDREGAWTVVDAIRRSLPYYDADDDDGAYNGVYVRHGDNVIVLDAIGWARVEEPLQ